MSTADRAGLERRADAIDAGAAAALLGVSRADALRLCQPRLRPVAAAPGPAARAPLFARRRRAAAATHRGAARSDKAAAHALQWGMPILESSIALIDGSRALLSRPRCRGSWRGRARSRKSPSLIWTGRFDDAADPARAARGKSRRVDAEALPFVARAHRRSRRAPQRGSARVRSAAGQRGRTPAGGFCDPG